MTNEIFRLGIGIPSGQFWHAQFAVDLISLVTSATQKGLPGYKGIEIRVLNVRSSILSRNRLDLVQTARKLGLTHVLFLDTDHTFPTNLVYMLARWGQDVVAANCVTKTIPAIPTARAKDADPRGRIVYTDPGDVHLERVWRVGTGVMLVKLSVFDKIGDGVWDMKYLPEVGTYQGEDWSFCEALEKADIPIFVDHEASQLVGHVGEFEFTHDYVGEISRSS